MKVEYSAHAEQKLAIRGISKEAVENLITSTGTGIRGYGEPCERSYRTVNGRSLIVVFRTVNSEVKVITVYHTRKLRKLISAKTKRGAWRETK